MSATYAAVYAVDPAQRSAGGRRLPRDHRANRAGSRPPPGAERTDRSPRPPPRPALPSPPRPARRQGTTRPGSRRAASLTARTRRPARRGRDHRPGLCRGRDAVLHLPSWLSYLVDQAKARGGRALYDGVYDRWSKLPQEQRPRLYVAGESLAPSVRRRPSVASTTCATAPRELRPGHPTSTPFREFSDNATRRVVRSSPSTGAAARCGSPRTRLPTSPGQPGVGRNAGALHDAMRPTRSSGGART